MSAVTAKPKARKPKAAKVETVLVLRTCYADMSSSHGFVWPKSGLVECKDWNPAPKCGNGLHGLLWGEGEGSLLDWSESAQWLVVEVDAATIVDLQGKVKFPRGNVRFCGDRLAAAAMICADPRSAGRKVVGGTATAGDLGTATAGYFGTATAGDLGTATAGYLGTATAGKYGTATAGEYGALCIHWYDAKHNVYRVRATDVDGEKIKPNVAYKLSDAGEFVEAQA